MIELPNRLRIARETAGISVSAMAAHLSVSRNTIKHMETPTGQTPKIRLDLIEQYAELTHHPVELLIFGQSRAALVWQALIQSRDEINDSLLAAFESIQRHLK